MAIIWAKLQVNGDSLLRNVEHLVYFGKFEIKRVLIPVVLGHDFELL